MAGQNTLEERTAQQADQLSALDPKNKDAIDGMRDLANRQSTDTQQATSSLESVADKNNQDTLKIDNKMLEVASDFIQKVDEEKNLDTDNCKKLLEDVKKYIKDIKKKSEKYSKNEIESFKNKENNEDSIIWKASLYIQAVSTFTKDCSEISDTELEPLQTISENFEIFSEGIRDASNKKIYEFTKFNNNLKQLMKNPTDHISKIEDLFKNKEKTYDEMAKNSYYSLKGNREKLLALYAVYLVLKEKNHDSDSVSQEKNHDPDSVSQEKNHDLDNEKMELLVRIASNSKTSSNYKNIRRIITPYVVEQIMKKEYSSLSYDEEELLEKEIERIQGTRETRKLTSFQKKLLEYEIKRRSKSNSSYDVLEDEDLEELKVLQRKIKKEEKKKNSLESAEKKSKMMSEMLEKSNSESSDESIVANEKLVQKIETFIEANKKNPQSEDSSKSKKSKHKNTSEEHSDTSKKSSKRKHHSKNGKSHGHSPESSNVNIPTIQEYVEVIHYLSQKAQADESQAKALLDRKDAIQKSIDLSTKESETLKKKYNDIQEELEEQELDKVEDWDSIDEDYKKIINLQENVIEFKNKVRLLSDEKLSKELEIQQKKEKEEKEKAEKERIENFSSEGVEENKKFIEKAVKFKDSFQLDVDSIEIVDVEGTDYSAEDEDPEHAYELAQDEDYEHGYELAETEDSDTSSGKKGFFSKLKSKIKKPTLHKKNSTSNANIDDLIKEYDINTMLKDGPKNIKNAANFILSKNKKNTTLLKAMKLLLNDISMVENDFKYFSADSSTNLNKLKFIERMENCVKRALYSLGEIDESDDNLKKTFILLTSFLREKEDKEINMMKIMDDRNKFNEKVNEENFLNYKVAIRERALLKKRSKRLLKERLQNKDTDDPRIKRYQELEEAELEEEALSQEQENEKDSRSDEARMSTEEKISEREHSIKIFCICLAALLPSDKQKKLKAKYLDPNNDIYHSIEPNVGSTLNDYNSKVKTAINEIMTDAKSGLDGDLKKRYIDHFGKNIIRNQKSAVLSKKCKSDLDILCRSHLSNNVTFKDICEDDFAEVLKRLR